MATPTAITALLRHLFVTFWTKDKRQYFITMRTFHLFLLKTKAFDKTFDIPFVSSHFIEKFSCPLLRKEPIEIILLARKEDIQIHLFALLFLR